MSYRDEHGDCNVPQSMGGLGDWVFNQRISYTKGRLSSERVGRLEEIGFTWRFVATDGADVLIKLRYWEDLWDWRYRELKEYRDKHGDCNVPAESQGPLGGWANRQRQSFKKGELSRKRVGLLESIGFVWDPTDEAWTARFDELVDFKNDNGDCNVPRSQGSLGKWANTQRQSYKKGKLSQERIDLLESIGFIWDLKERREWLDVFDELTKYKAANGDCNVPRAHGWLGEWVSQQRRSYKNGKLLQERLDLLENIGFVWEPLDLVWMACFDELVNFKSENGDCNVPYSQGPLGSWVTNQRSYYKKGKLSQERVDLLESIGFSWEPIDETWMSRFDELAGFKKGNGDCNVPCSQGPLGRWVTEQRRLYKKGILSQERIELLNSAGFEWVRQEHTQTQLWKLDEQWKMKFTELVQYLIEHGNCNVPQKDRSLGGWVGTQRARSKEGSMFQFRRDYLGSIGFAWKLKRVGNDWHPDQSSKPDPKAIARIIEDEKPRHDDLPASATEELKTRVNVGRCLAEALQEYLDKLENNG